MPNDQHSPHGRRPHVHRGRRGADRRGPDRRNPPPSEGGSSRDQVDVEQIMRDIRSRISRRHGIDLTPQQIQELAARRLEAILEPKHVKPALLEQMRRAAAEPVAVPQPPPPSADPGLDEADLYVSHRGFLQTLRRWLNPILKLFINPAPLVTAINAQARRAREAESREGDLYARQAEWNALHYEIIQRLVTELSRGTIEMQSLAMRVESLSAKVDFNERRVRGLENTGAGARPGVRTPSPAVEPPRDVIQPGEAAAPSEGTDGPFDAARRRRRRRRGRRSGMPVAAGDAAGPPAGMAAEGADEGEPDTDVEPDLTDMDSSGADIGGDLSSPAPEPAGSGPTALEPAHAFSLLQPVERHPSAEPPGRAHESVAESPRAASPLPDAAPVSAQPQGHEPERHAPPDRDAPDPDER